MKFPENIKIINDIMSKTPEEFIQQHPTDHLTSLLKGAEQNTFNSNLWTRTGIHVQQGKARKI